MSATPDEQIPVIRTEHPYVVKMEGICGGEPVIAGTRIGVEIIVGRHKYGESVEEILTHYPQLTHAQVHDALSYYYDHKDEIEQLIDEINREENAK